jgi:hypothetical protein
MPMLNSRRQIAVVDSPIVVARKIAAELVSSVVV